MSNPHASRYHAAGALDILQLLDDDERQHEIDRLLGTHDLLRTGSMLFKYHVVSDTPPSVSPSSTRAVFLSSEEVAEDVFASFTEEQKLYWSIGTAILASGDLSPLWTNTFSRFLARFPRAILDPQHNTSKDPVTELKMPETPTTDRGEWTTPPQSSSSWGSIEAPESSPNSLSASPLSEKSRRWRCGENSASIRPPPVHKSTHKTDLTFTATDQQATEDYPILRLICGGSPTGFFYEHIIDKTISFLEHRLKLNPESNLVGRYKGVQINYDPSATNIRGIRARMTTSVHRKVFVSQARETVTNVLAELEALMRPLVAWNRGLWTMSEFDHQRMPGDGDRVTYTDDYDSCVEWLSRASPHLFPITRNSKDEAIASIMDALLARASLYPSSPLVRYGVDDLHRFGGRRRHKILYFSLRDERTGFATTLAACFERDGLSSDEYLDLVEQQLYRLQREFPELNLTEASV